MDDPNFTICYSLFQYSGNKDFPHWINFENLQINRLRQLKFQKINKNFNLG